ncbi:hypothetical protein [Gracilibacillus salinarum]|uniref:Uncharacterized protein n=1 Tax=Gracilibacillus salinarum TaxID=2932255 RepID=A0ABY4GPQ2_9BACI|nr:hypothetical protein [Gracilibacillus salinarum]UOQ86209.1 hypothetical protein MUN87_04740 [Gracilibacillus salinarum]
MQLREVNRYLHQLDNINRQLATPEARDQKLAQFMTEIEGTKEFAQKDYAMMEIYIQASVARAFR